MEATRRSADEDANLSRETSIGLSAGGLAVAAMAVDYLIPGDPVAFLVTSAVALGVAALLFGRVIPRTKTDAEASNLAAKRAMVCSVLAVMSIPALWVGLPFVLGGAGIALGLLGRDGERGRLAAGAVALGVLMILFNGVYAVLGGSGG